MRFDGRSYPRKSGARIVAGAAFGRPGIVLAAIAIAALALFVAGGYQIRDVALRGTSAGYLVDADGHLLEVAG